MTNRYLLVVDQGGGLSTLGRRLTHEATARGFTGRSIGRRAWLGVGGPRPPTVRPVDHWLLIGDAIAAEPSGEGQACDGETLLDRFWGRFVGLQLGADDHPIGIIRDPSGAYDCVIWRSPALTVISSDTPDWLLRTLGAGINVDLDRVATILADPLLAWGPLALDGLEAPLPGVLRSLDLSRPDQVMWEPADRARRPLRLSVAERAEALRGAVDAAVVGLAKGRRRLGCEISGGLDSSIIASSLVAKDCSVDAWLNMFGADIETDERQYARSLAGRLRITPTFVPRREAAFDPAILRAISQGPRPGHNGIDYLHDQDSAAVWRAHSVDAVFTGKGGDTILVSGFDDGVFADLWRERGPLTLFDPAAPRIARATGRSVWAHIADARRSGTADPVRAQPNPLLHPDLTPGSPHGWLDGITDLPPGKQRQIAGVVDGLCFAGPSFQTEVADLLHPLLSRPVIDLCLALSTPDLTLRRGDRQLARDAFASRLPPMIAHRRTKGDHTAFFGQMIANSLGCLRPMILEGVLMRAGLLDKAAAESLLRPEVLIWRGGYGDLLNLIVVEAWAATWKDRLRSMT